VVACAHFGSVRKDVIIVSKPQHYRFQQDGQRREAARASAD
jgi:hypothetical protein